MFIQVSFYFTVYMNFKSKATLKDKTLSIFIYKYLAKTCTQYKAKETNMKKK